MALTHARIGIGLLSGLAIAAVVGVFVVRDASVSAPEDVVVEAPVGAEDVATASPQPSTVESRDAAPGPSLDLVRVDEAGDGMVAGTAEPNTQLAITLGEQELDVVEVGADGAFASFISIPQGDAPLPLHVRTSGDGPTRYSEQTVLIVPPKHGQALRPTIVLADASGAMLVQPSEPETQEVTPTKDAVAAVPAKGPVQQPLTLDTISYADAGEVVLTGRGTGAQFVRVYVDNAPVLTEPVADDGNWRVVFDGVKAGTYTLRVDQISPAGAVIARVESPFRRETPADVAEAAKTAPGRSSVTVQPGHSLWVLAEERYGDGVRYVQIFEANRDRIRDADLIYPGQIFDLPDGG